MWHDVSSYLNQQKIRKSKIDKSDLLDTMGPSESLCNARTSEANERNSSRWTGSLVVLVKTLKKANICKIFFQERCRSTYVKEC